MKTAYPKTLLIAFENITPPNPVDFSTSMRDMAYQYKNRSYKIKPYHLHPGNEAKLKRENTWMRKWLQDLLNGKVGYFEMMAAIKPRMPDLFVKGTRK